MAMEPLGGEMKEDKRHPFLLKLEGARKKEKILPDEIYDAWAKTIGDESIKKFLKERASAGVASIIMPQMAQQMVMEVFALGYYMGTEGNQSAKDIVDKFFKDNNLKVDPNKDDKF